MAPPHWPYKGTALDAAVAEDVVAAVVSASVTVIMLDLVMVVAAVVVTASVTVIMLDLVMVEAGSTNVLT